MNTLAANLLPILLAIPGSILAFSMRGITQAFVADKLGDPTPRMNGRLTFNPMAHLNIIGLIFIIIFGFGWTKPVPVNTRYFNKPKRDNAIFLLSGPLGCIAAGFVCSFFAALMTMFANMLPGALWFFQVLVSIFRFGQIRCVYLAAFYLLPLPGLDGYNLIANFLPYKYYGKLYNIEKYSMYIFIGFILLLQVSAISYYLFWPAAQLCDLMTKLWSFMY